MLVKQAGYSCWGWTIDQIHGVGSAIGFREMINSSYQVYAVGLVAAKLLPE